MQVTGTLADALNWSSISEDEFNAALSECSTEAERNQLIMDTLSGAYSDAADAFYENNQQLVEARKNQAALDKATANLGSAVSGLKTKLKNDLVPGLSDVTDSFADMISGVEGAEDDFDDALTGMIKNANLVLPKYIKLGGDIISEIGKGIVKNAPEIIDTLGDVLGEAGEVAGGLIVELVKGIPDMVEGAGDLVFNVIRGVASGVQEELGIMGQSYEEVAERIHAAAADVTAFADEIENAQPSLIGIENLLSETGKSASDLDAAIDAEANAVNAIFAAALSEGRELRATEIAEVEQHYERLRQLQIEKLGIAQGQQEAVLTAISAQTSSVTQEQAAQYLADIEAAYQESNSVAQQAYYDKLALLKNQFEVEGTLSQDEYDNAIVKAAEFYEAQLSENEKYRNQSVEALASRADDWIEADSAMYDELLRMQQDYNEQQNANLENEDQWEDMQDGLYETRIAMANILGSMQYDQQNAFLTMAAQAQAAGTPLSNSMQSSINMMLLAFEQLPPEMEADGKEAILQMISGLEGTYPELANASDMTVQEIVDTLRDNLGVVKNEGVSTGTGYASGVRSTRPSASSAGSYIASGATSSMNAYSSAYSAGSYTAQGFADGIRSGSAIIASVAASAASAAEQAMRKKLDMHSPSRVMQKLGEYTAEGFAIGFESKSLDIMPNFASFDIKQPAAHSAAGQDGALYALLESFLPQLLAAVQTPLVLDTGVVAAAVAPRVDASFGATIKRKERGN